MRSALSRHSSRAVGWKGGMWPCSGCPGLTSKRYAQQIHEHVVVAMQNIDSQRTKGKRMNSSRDGRKQSCVPARLRSQGSLCKPNIRSTNARARPRSRPNKRPCARKRKSMMITFTFWVLFVCLIAVEWCRGHVYDWCYFFVKVGRNLSPTWAQKQRFNDTFVGILRM